MATGPFTTILGLVPGQWASVMTAQAVQNAWECSQHPLNLVVSDPGKINLHGADVVVLQPSLQRSLPPPMAHHGAFVRFDDDARPFTQGLASDLVVANGPPKDKLDIPPAFADMCDEIQAVADALSGLGVTLSFLATRTSDPDALLPAMWRETLGDFRQIDEMDQTHLLGIYADGALVALVQYIGEDDRLLQLSDHRQFQVVFPHSGSMVFERGREFYPEELRVRLVNEIMGSDDVASLTVDETLYHRHRDFMTSLLNEVNSMLEDGFTAYTRFGAPESEIHIYGATGVVGGVLLRLRVNHANDLIHVVTSIVEFNEAKADFVQSDHIFFSIAPDSEGEELTITDSEVRDALASIEVGEPPVRIFKPQGFKPRVV